MGVSEIMAVGLLTLFTLVCGVKIGQTTAKGEDVKLPNINPMEAYREREDKKHAKMEQEKLDTIMRNIEAYDGTGNRQEDLPGR